LKNDRIIIALLGLCLGAFMFVVIPSSEIYANYQQEVEGISIIHSTKTWSLIVRCQPLRTTWIWNSTKGYRQISFSAVATGNCTIYVEFLYRVDEFSLTENVAEGRTYDITGPNLFLGIDNPNDKAITVYITFYMTT